MMVVARTVALSCFLVMLSYPLMGGTRFGRELFEGLADSVVNDPKGVPLLILALPLLFASSVLSLLVVAKKSNKRILRKRDQQQQQPHHRKLFSSINGDGNFDLYAVIFIAIPCIVYTITSIYRHLGSDIFSNSNSNSNNQSEVLSIIVKRVGNSLGNTAMVLFPFVLVPVAKHGPIIKLFGWDPARVVRLHIWCGRFIIFSSLGHGIFHLIRWTYLFGEQIQSFLLPPTQCFWSSSTTLPTSNNSDNVTDDIDDKQTLLLLNCQNEESNCSCYNHFIYLSGFLGAIALLLLLVTSSNWVRRSCYHVFYISHILLAPFFLLMVIVHYKRAILYIAPSILYYLAASMPVFQQRKQQQQSQEQQKTTTSNNDDTPGCTIVSVECLGNNNDNNNDNNNNNNTQQCISLTIAATKQAVASYLPGSYVQLLVPSISKLVSHPFTINKVPGRNDQLRIIFRTSGPFTTELANKLMIKEGEMPTIHLDGYHGSPDRLEQVFLERQHNHNGDDSSIVFVAGGIGITPYLSLLSMAVDRLSQEEEEEYDDDDEEQQKHTTPRRIVLHWTCRDPELIRYCQKEYFEPLLSKGRKLQRCKVEIHIHQTGSASISTSPTTTTPTPSTSTTTSTLPPPTTTTIPFEPSYLSPSQDLMGNLPNFATHASITLGGLTMVWFLYSQFQLDDAMAQRIVAPLAMIILAYCITKLVVVLSSSSLLLRQQTSACEQQREEVTKSMECNNIINNSNIPNETSRLINKKMSRTTSLSSSTSTTNTTTTATESSSSSSCYSSFSEDDDDEDDYYHYNDEEAPPPSDGCTPTNIQISHHTGRPDVTKILQDEVYNNNNDNNNSSSLCSTGVFCCGPAAIAHSIYATAAELERDTRHRSNSVPIVQVYDETFLI